MRHLLKAEQILRADPRFAQLLTAAEYPAIPGDSENEARRALEKAIGLWRGQPCHVLYEGMDEPLICFPEKLKDLRGPKNLMLRPALGTQLGHRFIPHATAWACSHNPYRWNEYVDPTAGVLRLAMGMGAALYRPGTEDFTRTLALNAPNRRPETDFGKVVKYSQRRVDFANLETGSMESCWIDDLPGNLPVIPFAHFFTEADIEPDVQSRALTFDPLLRNSPLLKDIQHMLQVLRSAFEKELEVHFTICWETPDRYQMQLLGCRTIADPGLMDADPSRALIASAGPVLGRNRSLELDSLVVVSPGAFSKLPVQDRHQVARLLGKINRALAGKNILLAGPGRWGTTSVSMGIPVVFDEICPVTALCEIPVMHERLMPDVSLGNHFFNELVASNLLYFAVFPGQPFHYFRENVIGSLPNRLGELIPDAAAWLNVIRVVRPEAGRPMVLRSDIVKQRVVIE
ncbi:MAG: hypothetical protein V2A34_03945 [Lentisphaerota bacterium]